MRVIYEKSTIEKIHDEISHAEKIGKKIERIELTESEYYSAWLSPGTWHQTRINGFYVSGVLVVCVP